MDGQQGIASVFDGRVKIRFLAAPTNGGHIGFFTYASLPSYIMRVSDLREPGANPLDGAHLWLWTTSVADKRPNPYPSADVQRITTHTNGSSIEPAVV